MKYKVGGAVHASTFIGEFEADSPEQAIELAYETAGISVCHQCADTVEDPEVACLWAEDEQGNVTSEPSDHDKIIELQARLKEASKAQAEWVAVSERLPEEGVSVIVDGGCAYLSSSGEWRTTSGNHREIQWKVTHWMPIPALPPPPSQSTPGEEG
jgi:hypothetical protein